jgi:hypothetical protein
MKVRGRMEVMMRRRRRTKRKGGGGGGGEGKWRKPQRVQTKAPNSPDASSRSRKQKASCIHPV